MIVGTRESWNNVKYGKERTMDRQSMYECGMCYFQGVAKDFTPITVSANFAALECPKCLNNDADSFNELCSHLKKIEETKAA